MGDWSYLSALLDKVQQHSTVVGKVWMSVLFLFRILVLGAAADNVWGDEHSEFRCETQEPGCALACYDWMWPVSYVRYWVLQIVFVTTPTLVYLGHAVHVVHREKRLRQRLQNSQTDGSSSGAPLLKQPRYTDDRGKVTIKGVLLRSYLLKLLFTIIMEVAFTVGQLYLYRSPEGGLRASIFVEDIVHCTRYPCSQRGGAECFVSRPTEKTIFIIFWLVVTGVAVLLNVLEVFYLLCARKHAAEKKVRVQEHCLAQQLMASSPPVWSTVSGVNIRHGGGSGGAMTPPSLPQNLVDICNDSACIDLVNKEKRT